MIDHVFGRRSTKLRRAQVLVVLVVISFGFLYLLKGNEHGPSFISKFSSYPTGTVTVWKVAVALLLWLYFCRNFATITDLE
ncbi:uncharacterized protein ASPGLDRAFT_51373 [Aspergillus glaucus CBS 516.65]|uniref:Uncharacterized protein n=1 Tax=Aspergillus glaucus CBS 516.65 TaxID=1160497 RepID=A0A1L9V9C8_ASPGL|nr:hypothetical protein ASPGLDRAFT_51373 [Aspergillus glaucus CBS 516.65]OJJ80537.1 hypothetical protein ASPGLDRAFT_51373 [Aspergillus glaucus CBS 516.65]